MAKAWSEVRAKAIANGQISEEGLADARVELDAKIRAYRLTEVRKAHGATQHDISQAMHISQPRVSRIERGELSTTEVGTLDSYVKALGGKLKIVADFGDSTVVLR